MVSYLPVGSEEATKWYVEQALKAGVGFINAIPVFIGREPYWQRRFAAEGLPVIGDDIKSQVGATISHRVLTRLFMDRGVRLDRTYQLNFGGNTDFLNMLERERLESKKISKTNAVTSMLDYELDPGRTSTSARRTTCRGSRTASGATSGWRARPSVTCRSTSELKLEVWDSPNSAGVITDAIRCLKLGLDRGLAGHARGALVVLHEEPAPQIHDDIACKRVEAFIRARTTRRSWAPRRQPRKTRRKLAAPAAAAEPTCSRIDGRTPERSRPGVGLRTASSGPPRARHRGRVLPSATRRPDARRVVRPASGPSCAYRARRSPSGASRCASRVPVAQGAVPGRLPGLAGQAADHPGQRLARPGAAAEDPAVRRLAGASTPPTPASPSS